MSSHNVCFCGKKFIDFHWKKNALSRAVKYKYREGDKIKVLTALELWVDCLEVYRLGKWS